MDLSNVRRAKRIGALERYDRLLRRKEQRRLPGGGYRRDPVVLNPAIQKISVGPIMGAEAFDEFDFR